MIVTTCSAFGGGVDFTLPEVDGDGEWTLLIDTNMAKTEPETQFKPGDVYLVTGRSLLLFQQPRQPETV